MQTASRNIQSFFFAKLRMFFSGNAIPFPARKNSKTQNEGAARSPVWVDEIRSDIWVDEIRSDVRDFTFV